MRYQQDMILQKHYKTYNQEKCGDFPDNVNIFLQDIALSNVLSKEHQCRVDELVQATVHALEGTGKNLTKFRGTVDMKLMIQDVQSSIRLQQKHEKLLSLVMPINFPEKDDELAKVRI